MKWITRERPKIDRIACPWLVTRFVDESPEFLYTPANYSFKLIKRIFSTQYRLQHRSKPLEKSPQQNPDE